MLAVHPDAELAPRDVVARAVAAQMLATGAPVYLDATALGVEFLARRFPSIDAAVREAGLDWSRQPVPVTPAAHYWMGGRSEEHTSELQSRGQLVCRLLLEKKKNKIREYNYMIMKLHTYTE